MKLHSFVGKPVYDVDERAYISPVRLESPLMRDWYLYRFYNEPGFHPNKQRCNTLLHGMSVPRGVSG